MKKWMTVAIAVLAVLALTIPAVAEETARPGITAHKANGIVIDGKLDDWNLDSPAVVEDATQLIKDAHMWKGANDLSAKFYLSWDEENLYIAADITEDTPLGSIASLAIDGADNIILFISTDPAADPQRAEYGTNDFMIYFAMNADETLKYGEPMDTAVDRSMLAKDVMKSVRFKSMGMTDRENVLPGYECAVEKTITGFKWEAKFAWADLSKENENGDKKCSLEKYTPAAGDVLSCDFAITDIDYPCPGTEYIPEMAWTGTLKIKTNPSLWGSVTLAE